MKRRGKRRLVPAIGLAALAVAAPASAGVRIAGVDTSGYPEVRVTVVAPGTTAEPQLRENGLPATDLQTANLARSKSLVLAVDRSQSMTGRSLRDATDAARAFVAAKAASDRIEVIAFGRDAIGLTKFSSSSVDADAALSGLTADSRSGTALYDAVVRAATALRREDLPSRVIVLVTDGRDVSSRATLDRAVAAAQHARAAVYAIGIAGHDFTPAPLRELAARTGGAYLQAASSADLRALYDSLGARLAHTWQLEYLTAARPGEDVHLTTVVGGARASRAVTLDAPGRAAPAAQAPAVLPRHVWSSRLGPGVLALAVGFLVLLAAAFANSARSGSWLNARLAPHLGPTQRRAGAKRRREGRTLRQKVVAATEQSFANVKQFRSLQRLLTRADLPLLAAELLYACVGCGFAVGLVLAVAGLSPLLTLVVMIAAAAGPVAWVAYRARNRMKAFDNQLPDLLITIAASLKAGHSFRHAIQSVVDEGAEPAAKEFRRVLTETRLGRPMDDALAEMGERVGSKNLTFVLNSVTIQRQIGGSLAGLFDMVGETVRQRQQFARKIRSLTAMGRMSAYVLVGLPFVVALLIDLVSPAYMWPLWHTSTGHLLMGTSLAMISFGSLILKKIVSFKG
ncbi:MAG TPA: type II secretion system F family protein [Gaiellaceae bacterium]|nr:type II secretion system F family protein [Gaiellaceae bacterium]